MENIKTLPSKVYLNPKDDVQITRAELIISNPLSLLVDLINASDKKVVEVVILCKFKDKNGDYLFGGNEFEFNPGKIELMEKSMAFLNPFSLDFRFQEAREVEIRIKKYIWEDGKVKNLARENQSLYALPLITTEVHEDLMKFFKGEIYTYGDNFIDSWHCVCGCVNDKDEEECSFCNRNKYLVLSTLTEQMINYKIASATENPQDFKTQTVTLNTTLNAPKVEEVSKIRKPEKKKNFPVRNAFLVILALVIIIGAGFLIRKPIYNLYINSRIKISEYYLRKGDYTEAKKTLLPYDKNPKVADTLNEIKELINSKKALEEGMEWEEKEEYLKAAKFYSMVLEKDKENYEVAREHLVKIQNRVLKSAKDSYESGEPKKAARILKEFLTYMPESAEANLALAAIKKGEPLEIDDTSVETNEGDNTGLRFTYQKTGKAVKLFESADVNSEVIKTLEPGTDLYIYEIQIEQSGKSWLRVEGKDPASNTLYHGWIRGDEI